MNEYSPFELRGCVQYPDFAMDLRMDAVSAAIREKPDWRKKYKQKYITHKWRDEALAQGITKEQFAFLLEELQYFEIMPPNIAERSVAYAIWQADDAIPSKLRDALIETAFELLENVPEPQKDWHPGSDNQVLDLVHPSLFPIIRGITRMCHPKEQSQPGLALINADRPKVPRLSEPPDAFASKYFQWLPADFSIGENGSVQIESYINNLHPVKCKPLYTLIAHVFERFVPLFERVLGDLQTTRKSRFLRQPNSTRLRLHSEPFTQEPSKYSLMGTYQVIVKMANIVLTPEKPDYPGGVWHVEGMRDEHIIATGIYYYSTENITASWLQFRQAVEVPNDYTHENSSELDEFYGFRDDDLQCQDLGSVLTKQDRLLAFPNIYQHRVAPFSLADRSKPGFRKILVFFLVDPTKYVLSSSQVPPQQKHWFLDVLADTPPFSHLPFEIVERIVSHMNWPMSLEQAKNFRTKLMAERKFIINENTKEIFERRVSLCEH